MKTVGVAAMGIAIVGLVLSLVLVVGGYLKLDGSLRSVGATALVGLLIVWTPTMFIKKRLAEAPSVAGEPQSLYSGCPTWMKRTGYALMALGGLIFFASVLSQNGVSGVSPGPRFIPSAAIGGFGLMTYSACFNQLYSGMRLTDDLSAAG